MSVNRIIALGASAGGLSALETFFDSVESSEGDAFVIIQHLSPDFKSLMPQLLASHTDLPIQDVTSGMELNDGQIYLIPAGHLMTIDGDGVFELHARSQYELSINVFFNSLATAFQERVVAVVLSGTGSDGTDGCRAVRSSGGLVISQRPESAQFSSMPQNVIKQRLQHLILRPEEMWHLIATYEGDPTKLVPEPVEPLSAVPALDLDEDALDSGLSRLFLHLKKLFDLDFSYYKLSSVSRRVLRRMETKEIFDIESYIKFIEESTDEADALYKDLLIGVTAFFRDTEVFETLRTDVVRPRLKELKQDEFRVWVAGCATGEEAYSIAILLDEEAKACGYEGRINIFATDVHKRSIKRAGRGIYSREELDGLSEQQMTEYFKLSDDGSFQIRPELRQRVVFAQHNLIFDPPFTKMDLVTCRNLLIYLKPDTQDAILRQFHYSINLNGALMLGSSESLGKIENSFSAVSNSLKIFNKTSDVNLTKRRDLMGSSRRISGMRSDGFTPVSPTKIPIEKNLLRAYDLLLRKFAPTGVLITRERHVRHFFGETSKYFVFREGRADDDVLSMLTGDVKLAVSTLIQRVISQNISARSDGIRCTTRHVDEMIDISAEPFTDDGRDLGLIMISFIERSTSISVGLAEDGKKRPTDGYEAIGDINNQQRIQALEDELHSTKENLQATVEELQTSNEELQAVNEELQVSNEELQSGNEELHSMNEELYTVNSELEQKNQQLIHLNRDHEYLLANTEDGVLYVDGDLRIKKFNEAIAFAFNLLPHDVGRPIEHISYNLENREEMLSDIQDVLESGARKERESKTSNGVIYLRRFTPFVGEDGKPGGVIMTYTDLTLSMRYRERLRRAMRTANMAWWEWDLQKDLISVHSEGNCILGMQVHAGSYGKDFWLKRVHPDEQKKVAESLNLFLSGEEEEWRSEHRYLDSDSKFRWVLEVGQVTRRKPSGEPLEVSGITMLIHDRKLAELDLVDAKERAEDAARTKSEFLSVMSHELRTPLNSVIGVAELLKMDSPDPSIDEYAETIDRSATVLLELINGILDFSKAEAGMLQIVPTPSSPVEVIKETVDCLSPLLKEKRFNVETTYDVGHDTFNFDYTRVRQVLFNLVSNACKFTPAEGKISVSVSDATPGFLKFAIEDDGIGMKPDFLKSLFEPFTQADSSSKRHEGGTGLGLSISKKLVEFMGGEITVSSKENAGTTFRFTIKSSAVSNVPVEASSENIDSDAGPVHHGNCLILDDERSNRSILERILKRIGYDATALGDPEECMKVLGEQTFDYVFIDLHMPGITGFEVADKIRGKKAYATTPIIAFTADFSKKTQDSIETSTFDALLPKPFSRDLLESILRRVREQPDEAEPVTSPVD